MCSHVGEEKQNGTQKKALSLEEEKLSFQVKKFPCLFDKSDKGYKEKDCVANSWKAVADSLEFIIDGNSAKTAFEKVRRRYNKKKNDVKKMNKSGTSTREFQKAERAFEEYKFLSWLDNFIYVREGRTNVVRINTSIVDDEDDLSDEDDDNNDEEEDCEESDVEDSNQFLELSSKSQQVIARPEQPNKPNDVPEMSRNKRKTDEVTKAAKSSKSVKRGKTNKSEYLDDMEMTLIRDLGKAVKGESKEKPQDDVDTYVKSLAVDLRKLQEREYLMAKHEIQSIVFKYQMTQYRQPTPTRLSSNKENVLNEDQQRFGSYQSWINS